MARPGRGLKTELRALELYFDGQMSSTQVGERLRVHHTTVLAWIRKYGLEPRDSREGAWVRFKRDRGALR